MATGIMSRNKVWTLPPLILHPFSDSAGPGQLVESSRASLMLQGLLPNSELSNVELEKRLLSGRFCEFRIALLRRQGSCPVD